MDFGLREWLIVAGIIVICGILIDGWRRMRGSRNRLKLRIDRSAANLPDTDSAPELLGSARVVEQGREPALDKREPRVDAPPRRETAVRREPTLPVEPRLGEDEGNAVPPARNFPPVEPASAPAQTASVVAEPSVAPTSPEAAEQLPSAAVAPAPTPLPTASVAPASTPLPTASAAPAAPMVPLRPSADSAALADLPREPRQAPRSGESPLGTNEPALRSERRSEPAPVRAPRSDAKPVQAPDEVLVITVVSRDSGGFKGPELLQNLLDSGLRFGDPLGERDIFHRHESMAGHGEVLFSMVNALKPGTFDMDNLEAFSTRAVSFFLTLPGPRNPKHAFDLMLAAARRLSETLQGDLKDEQRSVLTAQTIEHYRQRIADYERRARVNRR